jgi:hypothetical protein
MDRPRRPGYIHHREVEPLHLIRVGIRRINLIYLVFDVEGDGSPDTAGIPVGAIRVTLERGEAFVLMGDDADSYRRQVERFVLPDPAAPPASAFAGPSVGGPAPRPVEPEPGAGGGVAGKARRRERPHRG